MSEIDRRLEELFAAQAGARRVRRVTVAPRRAPWLALALAGAGLAALALVLALSGVLDERGTTGLQPTPAAPIASPTPSPTATICADPSPVIPSIAGTKSGRFMGTSLDHVFRDHAGTQWRVRFFIGPGATGDPGPAAVPLEANLTGPEGPIPVLGYSAGPPEGPFTALSGALTVLPCRAVVLVVTTGEIPGDGTYTLSLANVRRPEGDVATETYTMRLVCEPSRLAQEIAGSDEECRNPAGTGTTPAPIPTSSP